MMMMRLRRRSLLLLLLPVVYLLTTVRGSLGRGDVLPADVSRGGEATGRVEYTTDLLDDTADDETDPK